MNTKKTKVALINIGSELLRGRTINTNAAEIGVMMADSGFLLDYAVVIHDVAETIVEELDRNLESHKIIIITGGLGPTKDDLTKSTLAEYFGGELLRHQGTYDKLLEWIKRRGRKINDAMERQADIPDSCEILINDYGTAPGMMFRKDDALIFSLPGVPQEMRFLMKERVLPIINQTFAATPVVKRILKLFGKPESEIAMSMRDIYPKLLPELQLAYLPSDGLVKLEFGLPATPEAEALLDKAVSDVRNVFEDFIFTEDERQPEAVLGDYLKSRGMTIGLAESCTGGSLAGRLTSISGSSKWFQGSIVAYQEAVKIAELDVDPDLIEKHTVISEEVALAMARGVKAKLGTDVGLSVTGTAEVNKNDPVYSQPTIWVGYSGPNGDRAVSFDIWQDRKSNINRAVNTAILYALRQLKREDRKV